MAMEHHQPTDYKNKKSPWASSLWRKAMLFPQAFIFYTIW
jgi:hypothetical protein